MKSIFLSIIAISISIYGQGQNPVSPPCPDVLLPIVEVQINNTASNHDDYGSTGNYTICSARVVNFSNFGSTNFPGGVSVEIRNPQNTSSLTFSVSSDSHAGSPSIFAVLPED